MAINKILSRDMSTQGLCSILCYWPLEQSERVKATQDSWNHGDNGQKCSLAVHCLVSPLKVQIIFHTGIALILLVWLFLPP